MKNLKFAFALAAFCVSGWVGAAAITTPPATGQECVVAQADGARCPACCTNNCKDCSGCKTK